MKIVIAPNALKGSLDAFEAAEALAQGVRRALPEARLSLAPMADGGDGLAGVLAHALGGERIACTVSGPLGEPQASHFYYSTDESLAIIEMATAAGLALLPADDLDALAASTRGVGEMITLALERGARRIILGIGGSATTDGGSGLASALGVRFLDADGEILPGSGADLLRIQRIEVDGRDPRLTEVSLQVACDVDNPLLGERGAAAVFAPQKGADANTVDLLEAGLTRLDRILKRDLGADVSQLPGAGAAGGLGAGLLALFDAELLPGAELVAEAVGLPARMRDADLVLTAEGQLDGQTRFGKAPAVVADYARRAGLPCLAIGGALGDGYPALRGSGIQASFSLCNGPLSLNEAMHGAAEYLSNATEQVVRCFEAGRRAGSHQSTKRKANPMIRKCLFPAAGYGTRFLPATKAMPKEVLPVLEKPLIQYGVEESMEAGMTNIGIITGRGKRAIEDHFDISYELEHQINGTSKDCLLDGIRKVIDECTFSYTRQIEMKGLGHAILTGETLIGNEPFGVVLADDLCVGEDEDDGVLSQMLKIYEKYRCSILAIQEVDPSEVHKYGVIDGRKLDDDIYMVSKMVEKPDPAEAPSNLAIIGRYILTPDIFDILRRTPPGKNGELQITDALEAQAEENMVLAYKFHGQRFDCGSMHGFVAATNYFYDKSHSDG